MRMLMVSEVAEELQKSRDWVYKNWRAQRLPFRRIGGELRMRPGDLEAWIDSLESAISR